MEISNGKWSSVATAKDARQKQKRVRASASQSRAFNPVSLNLAVRKRETERIERENHAFAKRLFDKQAVLSKKKLDDEFKSHQKLKRQIAKVVAAPKGGLM